MFEQFTDAGTNRDQTQFGVMTSLSNLLSSRVPLTPPGLAECLPLFRYGMPSLFTPICDIDRVCSDLKAAILYFEPRIEKVSITVDMKPDKALSISIEGWMTIDQQATPIRYVLS
ncbi:hypothetical protein GCM10023116_00570 [Kistimonas scapharcae]|uniref:IraD/Gp25-like domain-containing protein n=1 Tax=Kistimonas scapharcae TaxID=1036133 RepID=A0ABP8UY81_9GAMM